MMRSALILFAGCILTIQVIGQKICHSPSYLRQIASGDPSMLSRLQEQQTFIQRVIESSKTRSTPAGMGPAIQPVIRIPVVVHVLYYSEKENISDQQVISQIDVLNRDFRKQNSDVSLVPEKFKSLAADCQLEFVLATTDPSGRPTSGIIRKKTGIQFFGLDDRIKQSARGGDDGWDADSYLNIWTGNLAGGVIGYSSPLGGPKTGDGVVIRYNAFGTTGKLTAPFTEGRTATHEVGHWLGLQHIWGDSYCGDDKVEDTPPQQGPSRGCPSGELTSCNNAGTMYMNYMDLTDDLCMHLFTLGQRQRMRILFQEGGARFPILRSKGLQLPVSAALPDEAVIIPAELRLFPNPAQTSITLTDITGNAFSNQLFTIYNQYGQAVKQFRFTGPQQEIRLTSLPAGIYLLQSADRKFFKRFIRL